MPTRSVILSLTGVLATVTPFARAEVAPSPPMLALSWGEGVETPAICLGRPNWFISVIPRSEQEKSEFQPGLLHQGDQISTKVLYVDPAHGLCLIETKKKLEGVTPFVLAKTGQLRPGQALHCRAGKKYCRTTVAGKTRTQDKNQPLPATLLRVRLENADDFCRPGMPLFDHKGNVVGVLTEREKQGAPVARAIPAPKLRKLIDEFETFRKSGNVRLGVLFEEENTTPEVHTVRPKSPAARGGVKPGDIFLKVNQIKIESLDELTDLCANLTAGKDTKITVLRGLERVNLVIVPEFR